MKKASSILYLIGAIFAIVAGVGLLVLGIMGLAKALPADLLAEFEKINQSIKTNPDAYFIGVTVSGVLYFASALLCLLARRCLNKGLGKGGIHIVIIVFSVLSFDILVLVAAILALASRNQPRAQE